MSVLIQCANMKRFLSHMVIEKRGGFGMIPYIFIYAVKKKKVIFADC